MFVTNQRSLLHETHEGIISNSHAFDLKKTVISVYKLSYLGYVDYFVVSVVSLTVSHRFYRHLPHHYIQNLNICLLVWRSSTKHMKFDRKIACGALMNFIMCLCTVPSTFQSKVTALVYRHCYHILTLDGKLDLMTLSLWVFHIYSLIPLTPCLLRCFKNEYVTHFHSCPSMSLCLT